MRVSSGMATYPRTRSRVRSVTKRGFLDDTLGLEGALEPVVLISLFIFLAMLFYFLS